MSYKALRPCKFRGQQFFIGDTVPDSLVLSDRAYDLMRQGVIILIEGGSEMHNYSLEEQEVGQWIDGKPLYEKSFEIPMSSFTTRTEYNGWYTYSLDLSTAESIWLTEAFMLQKDGSYLTPHTQLAGTNGKTIVMDYSLSIGLTGVVIQLFCGSTTQYTRNETVYVTVRYTKTTDTAQ